jgi:hypothetical protein
MKWDYELKVKSKNNKFLGELTSYLDMLKDRGELEDFTYKIYKEKEAKK